MHDLVVVSDLHIGRGKNPETGRHFSLEAFFYDEDFLRFCHHLTAEARRRGVPFKLILNGDAFDFLRIEPEAPQHGATVHDRLYGPVATPGSAARLVAEILRGHARFVAALAHVLESGNEVVFLPGNHDIEVQWEPVQIEIRRAILDCLRAHGEGVVESCNRRLRFLPWFYFEPGRIWIEHGCQYDTDCSFRYPLRQTLVTAPEAVHRAEQDLPLGNFFQRYLYNAFGHITFIVPSSRANIRYFKWMLLNEPRLLFRVLASHGPFAIQLLLRLARTGHAARQELGRAHAEELAALAESSGLGARLREIDALKKVRIDASQAIREVSWHVAKLVTFIGVVLALTTGLWFAGFHAITRLRLGFALQALLYLGLDFVLFMCTIGLLAYLLLRGPPVEPARPLAKAARRIASLLEVPIVTFGHTHDEFVRRVDLGPDQRAWYYNTGTWIAVFTHDVLLPRERVQLTFLRVRGKEAELLHWSPGRGEPAEVILLDDETFRGAPPEPNATRA